MNSLIKHETDKFSNKTTTETISITDGYEISIKFRHVSDPDIDATVMDIEYSRTRGAAEYMNLRFGKVVLRLNNKKNYTLIPHENFTRENKGYNSTFNTIDFVNVEESCWYDINPKLLKEIADASDAELKISGYQESRYFRPAKESLSLQTIAQVMYDSINNSKQYEKRISSISKNSDSYAKNVKRENVWEFLNSAIWVVGISGTLFVGGIWSLVISSWKPIIWFGVITVVLGCFSLYKLFNYDSKIKEYESTHK